MTTSSRIYEPRVAGGTYAPPNIAGSTSVVASTSPEPEAAFLMLAFLTTSSIMAMNEANANGVAPGTKSVLKNEKLRSRLAARQGLVRSARLRLVRAAHSVRLPGRAGNRLPRQRRSIVGTRSRRKRSTKPPARSRPSWTKNGFYKGADPMNFAATEPGLWIGKGKPLPF